MAGEPIPDDPAKKSKNLKALIDDRERPKKYGVLLLDALVQRDLRTAEAAMEAGADVNLPDDRGDAALLLIVHCPAVFPRASIMNLPYSSLKGASIS